METVTVLFTRRRALSALVLRTFLWSEWSHCSIVTSEGTVVEASALHGVREIPLEQALHGVSKLDSIDIPCPNATKVIEAARSQIGKPYDWFGVLGIAARRRWQDVDRWFCSELVAWAFAAAGSPIMRVQAFRITPRDVYIPIYELPCKCKPVGSVVETAGPSTA